MYSYPKKAKEKRMKELTLKAKPVEVLKVNVGDKSFSIPLANYLPFEELMKINRAEKDQKIVAIEDMLRKYIPDEIFCELTADDITQIILAWNEQTEETAGAKLGES